MSNESDNTNTNTNEIQMTEKRCNAHQSAIPVYIACTGVHKGKWVCSTCQKFIVWARAPKNTTEMAVRQTKIRRVLMQFNSLSERELDQLLRYYMLSTLTPMQKEIFDRLVN
jgi:hypothetical protein